MATTLCLSGAALLKAGANVSSNFISDPKADARWTELINQAEGTINSSTRYDWVANFASVNANFKLILEDVCACMAAVDAIQHDMSGYTGLTEAQTMLDVLTDKIKRGLKILGEKENTEKMI